MLEKEVKNYQYTYPVTNFMGVVTDTATVTGSSPDESLGAFINVEYKGLRLSTSLQDYRGAYIVQNVIGTNRWTKNFYNAVYDFKVSNNWNSSVNLTLNRATLRTGNTPNIFRTSTDVVTECTNYFVLGERINLVTGILYNHMKGKELSTDPNSGIDTISHNSRGAYAFYAQMDFWAIPQKLKLIGGFQANKMENLPLDIVPRFGLIYNVTERINIKALYGKAFRAGTVNETGIDYMGFFVGNPNLKPEHVENIDFGVNYQGKKIQMGINYFHSTQKNSIAQGPKMNAEGNPELIDVGGGFFLPVSTYNNIQNFYIHGLELEGKYYVTKQLYITGSALYQELNSDTTSIKSPVSNFGFKAGLSYSSDRGVTVSAFNVYQGKLKDGLYVDNGLNPSASKSNNTLNLYLNLDMIKLMNIDYAKKFSVFIQQENILDEEIWSNEAMSTSPYAKGRAIYVGLTLGL
jgi:outer membrane receptor for ferrienterochelin and colicin